MHVTLALCYGVIVIMELLLQKPKPYVAGRGGKGLWIRCMSANFADCYIHLQLDMAAQGTGFQNTCCSRVQQQRNVAVRKERPGLFPELSKPTLHKALSLDIRATYS